MPIEESLSRLKLERTVTSAHVRLKRPVSQIHSDHKEVKKITCLGSGFVGGMADCLPLDPCFSLIITLTSR